MSQLAFPDPFHNTKVQNQTAAKRHQSGAETQFNSSQGKGRGHKPAGIPGRQGKSHIGNVVPVKPFEGELKAVSSPPDKTAKVFRKISKPDSEYAVELVAAANSEIGENQPIKLTAGGATVLIPDDKKDLIPLIMYGIKDPYFWNIVVHQVADKPFPKHRIEALKKEENGCIISPLDILAELETHKEFVPCEDWSVVFLKRKLMEFWPNADSRYPNKGSKAYTLDQVELLQRAVTRDAFYLFLKNPLLWVPMKHYQICELIAEFSTVGTMLHGFAAMFGVESSELSSPNESSYEIDVLPREALLEVQFAARELSVAESTASCDTVAAADRFEALEVGDDDEAETVLNSSCLEKLHDKEVKDAQSLAPLDWKAEQIEIEAGSPDDHICFFGYDALKLFAHKVRLSKSQSAEGCEAQEAETFPEKLCDTGLKQAMFDATASTPVPDSMYEDKLSEDCSFNHFPSNGVTSDRQLKMRDLNVEKSVYAHHSSDQSSGKDSHTGFSQVENSSESTATSLPESTIKLKWDHCLNKVRSIVKKSNSTHEVVPQSAEFETEIPKQPKFGMRAKFGWLSSKPGSGDCFTNSNDCLGRYIKGWKERKRRLKTEGPEIVHDSENGRYPAKRQPDLNGFSEDQSHDELQIGELQLHNDSESVASRVALFELQKTDTIESAKDIPKRIYSVKLEDVTDEAFADFSINGCMNDPIMEKKEPQKPKCDVDNTGGTRNKIERFFAKLTQQKNSAFNLCKKRHSKGTKLQKDDAVLKGRKSTRMMRRKQSLRPRNVFRRFFTLAFERIGLCKTSAESGSPAGNQIPLFLLQPGYFQAALPDDEPKQQQYLDDPRGWTTEELDQYGLDQYGQDRFEANDSSRYYNDLEYRKAKREGKQPAYNKDGTKNKRYDEGKPRTKNLMSEKVSKRSSFAEDFFRHPVGTTETYIELIYEGAERHRPLCIR